MFGTLRVRPQINREAGSIIGLYAGIPKKDKSL